MVMNGVYHIYRLQTGSHLILKTPDLSKRQPKQETGREV